MKTTRHPIVHLSGITLAVALSLAPAATLWADAPTAPMPPPSLAAVQSAYGQLPLSFEANRGQTDSRVNYLARGPGYTLLLTPDAAVLALRPPAPHSSASPSPSPVSGEGRNEGTMLRLQLVGATHTSNLSGVDELPGKVHYFIGNNPEQWRTNVPTFAKVTQPQVYPGIDVVYYGNQQQLEFDFIVAPGADPQAIRLKVEGADRLEIDAHGDLLLHVGSGDIQLQHPCVYQEVEGVRKELSGQYVVTHVDEVRFQVAAYDTTRPLIIDPTLFYSTYLGGSGYEEAPGIAVDASGNAYVTGRTDSLNFPGTNTSTIQPTNGGGFDAFVTKLNPTGSGLVYSTYLGGSGDDYGLGIAIDSSGNAYVTGLTTSSNFPGTSISTIQSAYGGGDDGFVTKLNAAGSALVYSTFLGGSGYDAGNKIAVDSSGNAYVTGTTGSSNFPGTSTSPIQPAYGGGQFDAFVTQLNAAGSAVVYSTYLGGSGREDGWGVDVDSSGNAYVTGGTYSTNFPGTSTSTIQPTNGGGQDGYVTKLNAAGSALVYSTYLGGSGNEDGHGIAVNSSGNAYVTGVTSSSNFPGTSTSTIQPTNGGGGDGFVTNLNAAGSALVYSTYLGGTGYDQGTGIAVDASGNAYVTGRTNSLNFPGTSTSTIQPTNGGSDDAFVTKLNAAGSALVYSTYLGGSGLEYGYGVVVDSSGSNAYVSGVTQSTNFPTTAGAFQSTLGGTSDGFVAKIVDVTLPPPPPPGTAGKVTGGGTINVSGGIGNFGFIVQRKVADGSIRGELTYKNHGSGAKIKSESFTSFFITGNTAVFEGTGTNNGAPCTVKVTVMDNGEPGTNDSFTISVSGGPIEGGTLRSGSIQIH